MGSARNCENCKKLSENCKIQVEEHGAIHILFYFCAFLLRCFWLEKVHFSHCFIQNWEEIESLKNENSPGILFSHFRMNPGYPLLSAYSSSMLCDLVMTFHTPVIFC